MMKGSTTHFWAVPFYWLKVKYQYVHYFLQQDAQDIRNRLLLLLHIK